MTTYNVFEEAIPEELKEKYAEEYAQTSAVLDAADLISEAMEAQGLNQKDLASKLGVSKGYVSRLLSGNENMTVKSVARVLHVLGYHYQQTLVSRVTTVKSSNIVHFIDYVEDQDIEPGTPTISTNHKYSDWSQAVS
jgi:transcriptional regulator with XRE-family HTH domain